MKVYNPFYTENPVVMISVVITLIAAFFGLIVLAFMLPELLLLIISLIAIASVANVVKYIFTGKGFIQ